MVRMNPKLLQRRQDMWDCYLAGTKPSVFISELAAKYKVKEETLWVDWGKRGEWSWLLFQLENAKTVLQHRLYELKKAKQKCFQIMETADNDSAKVGAIKQLQEIIKLEFQIYQSVGWLHKKPNKIDLSIQGMPWRQHPVAQQILAKYEKILLAKKNGTTKIPAT